MLRYGIIVIITAKLVNGQGKLGIGWSVLMKTTQVARRLGISPSTIYKYTTEKLYAQFFSDEATRKSGRQQSEFYEEDVVLIWTIFRLRKKMSAEEVAAELHAGYRVKDFPTDGSIDKVVDNIKALGIVTQRDAALTRIDELQDELERLQTKNDENVRYYEGERRKDAEEIGRLKNEVEFLKRALPAEVKKLLGLE
jgi:hypothetical protein